MRATGAVKPEQIVSRSSRRLGGRACGNVLHRDVVDRDRDLILLAPVLCKFVEPVSYAGTKWLHCTIDSDLLSAKARDTNGAEIIGAAPAVATVRPVSFKNRRRVTRGIVLVPIFGSSFSLWGQSDEADPDERIAFVHWIIFLGRHHSAAMFSPASGLKPVNSYDLSRVSLERFP